MSQPKCASLSSLDDDTLIYLFSFLDVEEILRMRRLSPRFTALSLQRVVWTRALTTHVLRAGLPFPPVPLAQLSTPVLEALILRARELGDFWRHPPTPPAPVVLAAFGASAGTGVSDVRFVPVRPGYIVAVTKGIWPLITCWDVPQCADATAWAHRPPRRVAEWFRKGALFTGIAVNADPDAEGWLAVSLSFSGEERVEVLTMRETDEGHPPQFVTLATIKTRFRAMALKGDLLAVSDDVNETHLVNWRTNCMSALWGNDEPSEHNFQHNRCLQVVFSRRCVFVVRARSFEAFINPQLHPPESVTAPQHAVACHRFGWLDGVAVTEQKQLPIDLDTDSVPPVSILLRAESDDPWSSDVHTLDLYTLHPDTTYPSLAPPAPPSSAPPDAPPPPPQPTPYAFPPRHTASFSAARGHLRCTDIRLGAHGTAVWIQPRPAHALDLTALDVHASDAQGRGVDPLTGARVVRRESVVGALLPGVLRDGFGRGVGGAEVGGAEARGRREGREGGGEVQTLWSTEGAGGTWTALDYDEARGLVALGDSAGVLTVLRLH